MLEVTASVARIYESGLFPRGLFGFSQSPLEDLFHPADNGMIVSRDSAGAVVSVRRGSLGSNSTLPGELAG